MTHPISSGIPPGSSPSGNNPNMIPPGPPLPANDPWVRALALLFPNAPLGEIMMYAGKFRENMFQALNNQIQRDLKKAREASKKLKDAIEGKD